MGTPRERWVDIAKGIAIVLVVFYHAVMFTAELGIAHPWEPIYLVHTFPLVLVNVLLLPHAASAPGWVGFVQPIVMTVVSIGIALMVYRLLKPVPGIFDFPVARWVHPATT